MNDLQTLLDGTTLESLNNLSAIMDKEELSQSEATNVWGIISNILYEETGTEPEMDDLTNEEINKWIDIFKTSVALYIAVRQGHMKIVSGRIKLTDGENAKLSLTERGTSYVENKILKK